MDDQLSRTVVILHPHFTIPGGAGKVALEVAKRLQQRGYRVVLLTGQVRDQYHSAYPELQFISLDLPLTDSWLFWFGFPFWQHRIETALDKLGSIILFPQIFPANWWAFIYGRRRPDIPCVWFCHEPSAFIHSTDWINAIANPVKRLFAFLLRPIFNLLDRYLVSSADTIVANSSYNRGIIEKTYHRRVDIIAYPGVDQRFHPRPGHRGNYLFVVSRLTKFKRIHLVIEAFARLREFPHLRLLIAGVGDDRSALERLARKKDLQQRTVFLGAVTDEQLPTLYAQANVVVFASMNEPFGIVPIEGMASGTPVVASRSGGPMETINDGQTGYLFTPGDVHDLANKLRLVLDPINGERLGQQGSQIVKETYSWERCTDSVVRAISLAQQRHDR